MGRLGLPILLLLLLPPPRADGGSRWRWDELACSWPVTPRIIQGNRTFGLAEATQGGFPVRLLVTLELERQRLLLELEQNWGLVPRTQVLIYYLPNGTRVTQETGSEGNCCYWGQVQGYPDSWASVCICSGLRGLLVVSEKRSYSLEPGPEGPHGRLRAYRLQDVGRGQRGCELGPPPPGRLQLDPEQKQRRLRRGKRQADTELGYVELVMVTDKAEFQNYPNLKQMQTQALEIASQMDAFYRPLGLRVALVGIEVWHQRDRIRVDSSPRATLERFLEWRQRELLPQTPHDSAQLLTGIRFANESLGMATQGSICSGRSGGVSTDHSVSALVLASTLSHQLGHNLGLLHDGDGCSCQGSSPELPPSRSCIMEPSTGLMPGLSFSGCSRRELERSLRGGRGWCLLNMPEPRRLAGAASCGNRLVEQNEECDCGLREECTDPCCNTTACRLLPGAQCTSQEDCCQDCKLRSVGSVCREPRGECDLPEFCDGVSPRCPPNAHLQDGAPCAGGLAVCYGGTCPTYQSQCQELWHSGSVPVSDACLATLNSQGNRDGHCGQRPDGTYIPCAQRNVRCGRLQCWEAGANRTVRAAPCPHSTPPSAADILDLAMVQPGTACGPGKVCIERRCQDLAELGLPQCQCHGHGVCNSYGHCHCGPGWAPPDCQSTGLGGSLDSGPPAPQPAGSATPTALLTGLALLLALALGLCYAKRAGLHKHLCRLGKGTSCQYRLSQPEPRHYSQAAPERPRPPQLRQSTEMQLMATSKSALLGSERPDPPSKPLPPDPLPKGLQAAPQDRPAPPTRPLPADPVPRGIQPPGPVKPPPPRKPLPSDPDGPLLSRAEPPAVPGYGPHILVLPSRPAPPPPAPLSGYSREA